MSTLRRIVYLLALIFSIATPAFAADSITGTVINKTTNKPSAGDDVVLIQLKQGMQESTRTKTDAHGHFKLAVPDDGIHLVRVTHDKASYFKPATPGTQTVDIEVYNAGQKVEGVALGVQELHIEATDTELHVVEVLQVLNQSEPKRTQFGPAGFDFFVPADARILRTGAITDGGMPVPATAAPVGDPGHYTFLFPIRPGETQFGIVYSVPYNKSLKFTPRLASNVNTLAIVLPKSMKLQPGPSSPYSLSPAAGDTQTYMAQNVSPSQPIDFTLTGTGALPQKTEQPAQAAPQSSGLQGTQQGDQTTAPTAGPESASAPDPTKFGGGLGKPLDPDADHDPWAKYKGWILGGLALLLAVAAGVLLRRPITPVDGGTNPWPSASVSPSPSHALKDEYFALETDRLKQTITAQEYEEHKRALDLVLGRILARDNGHNNPTTRPEEGA